MKFCVHLSVVLALGLVSCARKSDDSTDPVGEFGQSQQNPIDAEGSTVNSSNQTFSAMESNIPSMVPELTDLYGLSVEPNSGAIVAFYTENRYFAGYVKKIASTTYQIMGVVGHYSQDGRKINFKAARVTCRDLLNRGPSADAQGVVGGREIVVTTGSTSAVYVKQTYRETPANGNILIWGCFDKSGATFTPEAWSDI